MTNRSPLYDKAKAVVDAWQGFVPPALYHALIELRDEMTRIDDALAELDHLRQIVEQAPDDR